MRRNIYLYGYLAEQYGRKLTLDVASIGEAVRALEANFPGFQQSIRDGEFHVACGEEINQATTLCEDELPLVFEQGDFHIAPAIAGRKEGGVLRTVLGVMLIAVAAVATVATGGAGGFSLSAMFSGWTGVAASMGVSMTLSGVSSMLAPTVQAPDYAMREKPEERPSYIFDGPVNRTEQGGVVPLIYGEVITGSIVLSGSIRVEEMATTTETQDPQQTLVVSDSDGHSTSTLAALHNGLRQAGGVSYTIVGEDKYIQYHFSTEENVDMTQVKVWPGKAADDQWSHDHPDTFPVAHVYFAYSEDGETWSWLCAESDHTLNADGQLLVAASQDEARTNDWILYPRQNAALLPASVSGKYFRMYMTNSCTIRELMWVTR